MSGFLSDRSIHGYRFSHLWLLSGRVKRYIGAYAKDRGDPSRHSFSRGKVWDVAYASRSFLSHRHGSGLASSAVCRRHTEKDLFASSVSLTADTLSL